MPSIKVEIVTAERIVYSGEVNEIVAPGAEGQLGILPHHAPLMTSLDAGELVIKTESGEIIHRFFLSHNAVLYFEGF